MINGTEFKQLIHLANKGDGADTAKRNTMIALLDKVSISQIKDDDKSLVDEIITMLFLTDHISVVSHPNIDILQKKIRKEDGCG